MAENNGFYGRERADVPPVNEKYKRVENPVKLYEILSDIWCAKTCAPRMRGDWTKENKTLGQCSVTAFLAQDIFGGKVCGIELPDGNFHCYNVVGNCFFDLTSEQFGDKIPDYKGDREQFREVHFAKEEKYKRYLFLRNALDEYLAGRPYKKDQCKTALSRIGKTIDGSKQKYHLGGKSMNKPVPGTGGNRYVPYEKREGAESVVFFTRDLSGEGLKKIYDRVGEVLKGKIAVKLHTGEAKGPNFLPRPWVKELLSERLPGAEIVETNTYYEGSRYTTEEHRKTLEINGWTFCPVNITDEFGVAALPVENGKWFREMHVGKGLLDYDSLLVLTHFKGHTMGGFGGSNKNIGIGCADGRVGKKEIHTPAGTDNMWGISEEEFMERMTESTKSVIGRFSPQICFINVMRNMSVSCDCEGSEAEPVVTPDIGILASLDILAVDQACVDLIYNLPENGGKALIDRVESRHGLRQLSYMKEMSMGNDRYRLIDIDNNDALIDAATAVKDVKPGWRPDRYNVFWGRNKRPE